MDWSSYLNILKQNGPIIGVLLAIIWLQWRNIDKLLERNSQIYEAHIKSLYETQDRLLTKVLGPRPSSQEMPTIKQLQESVREKSGDGNDAANGGKR